MYREGKGYDVHVQDKVMREQKLGVKRSYKEKTAHREK